MNTQQGAFFEPGNTLMTNSIVGDAWIRQACEANPTVRLANGGISTGPVRLAFTEQLVTPRAPSGQPNGTPKYSVCGLYTPFADMNVLYQDYYKICGEMFPEYWNQHLNSYSGLESPFHDGATKAHKFQGYTPGLWYINHTSKYKPPIVDANRNPFDTSKIYPGMWAILVVNAYGYGKSPPQPKKGVSFGLQAVMIIGDDKNLSGGGIDPREAFKGVVVKPPAINPAALGGLVPPPPTPTGAPDIRTQHIGGFAPPPPPNPLYTSAIKHAAPAADDLDLSSLR